MVHVGQLNIIKTDVLIAQNDVLIAQLHRYSNPITEAINEKNK